MCNSDMRGGDISDHYIYNGDVYNDHLHLAPKILLAMKNILIAGMTIFVITGCKPHDRECHEIHQQLIDGVCTCLDDTVMDEEYGSCIEKLTVSPQPFSTPTKNGASPNNAATASSSSTVLLPNDHQIFTVTIRGDESNTQWNSWHPGDTVSITVPGNEEPLHVMGSTGDCVQLNMKFFQQGIQFIIRRGQVSPGQQQRLTMTFPRDKLNPIPPNHYDIHSLKNGDIPYGIRSGEKNTACTNSYNPSTESV